MKKNLLIVGAGGHGRCCLDIARESQRYDEISFLDDGCVGSIVNGARVLDTISNLKNYKKEYQDVFVAIGNNKFRRELQRMANAEGYCIPTFISDKAYVSTYAIIGKGSVIFPGAVIEANVSIGNGCIVTSNATINHDAILESYVLVYSNTVIRPNTKIKELARIGSGCVIRFGSTIEFEADISDGTIV